MICPRCKTRSHTKSAFCSRCGSPLVKAVTAWKVSGVIGLVFALFLTSMAILLAVVIPSLPKRDLTSAPNPTSTPDIQVLVEKNVYVQVRWRKGGFGTVMLGNVTINNESNYAAKDFEIECEVFGGSGTKIDTINQTLYETVPAQKTKTFNEVNFGFIDQQARSVNCKIEHLTVIR